MEDGGKLEQMHQQLMSLKDNRTLDSNDADRSENLHRLFIYPAMMVPAAQYAVIKAVSTCLPHNANAIDPFMGSGTSLMSCMEFDFNVFGQDINPFAVLLTKAKVERYDIAMLKSVCDEVLMHIREDVSETIDISFPNIDKWFSHNLQIDLSKIRRAIQAIADIRVRYFLWAVMSEVIRTGSNDRTSTFKLHCRKQEDIQKRKINVIKEFEILVCRGIDDIKLYWEKLEKEHNTERLGYSGNAVIQWGNSQESIQTDMRFDLLVSSPPYGDNHTTVTYGQTSYLPLQWIDPTDLSCPYDYVKTTQEIDRRSLGGRISKKEIKTKAKILFKKTFTLKSFYESIPDEEKKKYYKTIAFISDFDDSLDKIVEVMKPNAFYIWTIGNRFVGSREIPNDNILIDLMESRGLTLFERAERQILNKKQANKNNYSKTMEKEHILIFHKRV
jgi:hypothetical protein